MLAATPVTIVIVDDHTIFRQALRELLESADAVTVVGEAATTDEAIAVITAHKPQVALVDLDLGEENGLRIIEVCSTQAPETRYLMLSAHDNVHDLRRAMGAGAHGYLLKGVTAGQLVDGIVKIAAGDAVLDPILMPVLVDQLTGAQSSPMGSLSVREHEVLALVAEGRTSKGVAEALGISARTVQKHLESIYRKLGVASRAELVQLAFRSGLLH